ncbi:MAG: hypothetical protein CMJ12_02715 [Pelagibacterales bacterium]|nr:hypothetical protein [Pelagibacterales bacterium]
MYKYIYKLFLACSALVSLLCLGIITLCILILSTKTITIQDYNQYVSKLVSWYFDQEIFFDEIQINNSSMQEKYEIQIKNIFIEDKNNYKNFKIEKLKLNFDLVNLFNKHKKFSEIDVKNLYLDYISNNIQDNDVKLNFLDYLFKVSDVLKVSKSKINIKISDHLYYLSDINFKKFGINSININGSFNYRDDYYQLEDKLLEFSSSKFDATDIINIKFKNIKIDEFIFNKYLNNKVSIKGLISGELRLNFKNSLLSNIDFDVFSQSIFPSLKSNIKYKKLVIHKIPTLDSLQIKGSYNHKKENLYIEELKFNIINANTPDSNLHLINKYNYSDKVNDIKFSFSNLDITTFISIESIDNYFDIFNNISGTANIILNNYKFNSINLIIDNIFYDGISVKDIIYNYNEDLDISHLSLSMSTKYKIINSFFDHFNVLNHNELINFNPEDNIKLNAIFYLQDTLSASINGNIIFDKPSKVFFNDFLLKSADFTINYKNKNTEISAILNTNISDIKISYIKDQMNRAIVNLFMPIVNKKLTNIIYIKDLKGKSFLECSIIYLEIKNYNCNLNLMNTSFSIPFLNYKKNMKKDAKLNITGDLKKGIKFDKINFKYNSVDNIIEGYLLLPTVNSGYLVNFNKFILNKNNLNLGAHFYNNELILDLYSGTLDLNSFIENNSNLKNLLNIYINGKVEKIFIKDFFINNATISYKDNKKEKLFNLKGNYYSDENIIFNYKNTDNLNILSYDFKASNAGKFFELLNYKSEIKEGILSSQGFIGNLDDDNSIMGTLSIDNFKVMKAPLFAELLLAASFTGLFELLNNEGIEFEQFDAQFTGKNNIFNIIKSRAYGFSLGLTGAGNINYTKKIIDLSGSIIPAYKINSLLNNVPLLGQLLTAKEDEGLFAINYDANGPWQKPKIIVNPLSLLTPGIIRNIFN